MLILTMQMNWLFPKIKLKYKGRNEGIISKISKLNEIVGNRSDLILDQKEEFIQYEKLSLTDWDLLEKKYNSYLSEIFTAKEKISLKQLTINCFFIII